MQNMAGRAGHVTQDRSLPFLDPASLQGGEELPGGRELCQLGGFQALQPLVKCGFPSGWSRQAQRTCTSNSPQGCWCGPHAMAEEDWVPVGGGGPAETPAGGAVLPGASKKLEGALSLSNPVTSCQLEFIAVALIP